jgi:hypothetical protein
MPSTVLTVFSNSYISMLRKVSLNGLEMSEFETFAILNSSDIIFVSIKFFAIIKTYIDTLAWHCL